MNYMLLEACENTDNGLKDMHGAGCEFYSMHPEGCSTEVSPEGFVSNQMCCVCGGGKTPVDSGKF